jgi:hypothetical protein
MQTVASVIDVHVNINNGDVKIIPVNISHHFYDEHLSTQHESSVSVDSDISQTGNHDIHHSCSGHVSFLSLHSFSSYHFNAISGSDSFNYNRVFFSIISIPDFRPPISS